MESQKSAISEDSIRTILDSMVDLKLDEVRLTKLISQIEIMFDTIQPLEDLAIGAEDDLKGVNP